MAFLGARGRAIPRCSSCTARRIFSFNPYRKPSPAWIRDFSSSGGKRPQPGDAPKKDKIQWYPIPVGLGIGVVGLVQFYKVSAREKERQREAEEGPAPKARPRVKLEGPWYNIFLFLFCLANVRLITSKQAGSGHVYTAP